jgi:hypothetical protein
MYVQSATGANHFRVRIVRNFQKHRVIEEATKAQLQGFCLWFLGKIRVPILLAEEMNYL